MKNFIKLMLSSFIAFACFIITYSNADATGMTITLSPGWNVVSTPALLSDITFSNGGNGISFSKMENGQWISVNPNTTTFKPLEGFLVNNSNNENITMTLTYKVNVSPTEALFTKNLSRGRNFLGITTTDNPFYNVGNQSVDFTYNGYTNLFNKVNTNYMGKNSTNIDFPEYGESYGIFVTSSDAIYGGSNNKATNDRNYNITLSNNINHKDIIQVTPGSYNIPIIDGIISTDRTIYFNNAYLDLQINNANPYEYIAGLQEAGGLIYDINIQIGGNLINVSKEYYSDVTTDANGNGSVSIPLNLGRISQGTHEFKVLLGINKEYAVNFKTGTTISTNIVEQNVLGYVYYILNGNNKQVTIDGEILPSDILISHNGLPNLAITSIQPTNVEITDEINDFLLWSGILHTTESGLNTNITIDFDRTGTYSDIDVSIYVDGQLIDKKSYRNKRLSYEIPLQENVDTTIEIRGSTTSFIAGVFSPRIMINKILKDNIHYATCSCDYYYKGKGCYSFNGGNYIYDGGLFTIQGTKPCTAEELLACIAGDNYDECVASCGGVVK